MKVIIDQFYKLIGGDKHGEPLPYNPWMNKNPGSERYTTYFLDLVNFRYSHMANACEELVGCSSKYLIEGGVESYVTLWTERDYEIFCNNLLPIASRFLAQKDPGNNCNYVFGRNYFVNTKQGIKNILEKHAYLYHPDHPNPVAIAGYAIDITHFANSKKRILTVESADEQGIETLIHKQTIFNREEDQNLTQRELEVLKWVFEGLSSKQIAHRMKLSIHTINNHRKSMLDKTGASNSADLVKFALSSHLL